MTASRAGVGAHTSRASHFPPRFSISVTRCGVEDGEREVAITWWEFARACLARARPKPEEQPVISQIGTGGDMLVGSMNDGDEV